MVTRHEAPSLPLLSASPGGQCLTTECLSRPLCAQPRRCRRRGRSGGLRVQSRGPGSPTDLPFTSCVALGRLPLPVRCACASSHRAPGAVGICYRRTGRRSDPFVTGVALTVTSYAAAGGGSGTGTDRVGGFGGGRGGGRPGSCVLAGAGRTGGCDALGDASQQPAAPSRVTPRFGEARCSLSRETWRDSTAAHFLDRKKQQVGIFFTYYTMSDVNVRDVRNPLPAAWPYLSPPQPSTRLHQVGAGRRWAVQVAKRVN